jgi:hypothetical protein
MHPLCTGGPSVRNEPTQRACGGESTSISDILSVTGHRRCDPGFSKFKLLIVLSALRLLNAVRRRDGEARGNTFDSGFVIGARLMHAGSPRAEKVCATT